jgi:hypothetical protein
MHERLLDEIREEFPSFQVVPKRDSALQKAIDRLLRIVTFGGQREYLTRYHTVLFGKLFVPDTWDAMDDRARYVLLRHERVHLRQRRRMGDVGMAIVYLLPIFPLGLAWGRARIEWEARFTGSRPRAGSRTRSCAATRVPTMAGCGPFPPPCAHGFAQRSGTSRRTRRPYRPRGTLASRRPADSC